MTESDTQPQHRLHPVPPDPSHGQFAEAKLLVVDDDPANVALLLAVFRRAGYRNVVTEMDPRKVTALFPEVDPDLVILDLHMPHLDGFAVLAQIRHLAPPEALPVLVLTADATPVASERALGSGAQDFVIKPFSTGEVLVRVRNLLRARFVYKALQNAIADRRKAVLSALWLTTSLESEQQVVERLRFFDGLKDTLLQTVSHDLRNPIWAMLLLTDVLADDADGTRPLPAETRSSIIGKIQHSARHMERLLADILDSDPMRTVNGNPDPCVVGDVVNRVLAEVDLGRDHPLEVDISFAQADVDPAHLERIVENLLSNARQHVAPGVPIWVTVARCTGGMVFSVEDAGPGVPQEIAGSIFEPFRRGRAAAGAGLGLGLSLVARFAQLHSGRAWAEETARRWSGLPSVSAIRGTIRINPGGDRVTRMLRAGSLGCSLVTVETMIAGMSTRASVVVNRPSERVSHDGSYLTIEEHSGRRSARPGCENRPVDRQAVHFI